MRPALHISRPPLGTMPRSMDSAESLSSRSCSITSAEATKEQNQDFASGVSSLMPAGWASTSSLYSPASLSPESSTTRPAPSIKSKTSTLAVLLESFLSSTRYYLAFYSLPLHSTSIGVLNIFSTSSISATSPFSSRLTSSYPAIGSTSGTFGRLPSKSSSTCSGHSSSGASGRETGSSGSSSLFSSPAPSSVVFYSPRACTPVPCRSSC